MTTGKTFVRRRGTTPLPNATVHDERLSYAALGLLAVILARPATAPQGYRHLMGRGLGQSATLTALRELTDAGYRHQVRRPGPRGQLITDTVVSEEPITAEEAADWLLGEGLIPRAPGVKMGRTARGIPTHGATSANTASSQVAPRVGSPGPGRPGPGQGPHTSTEVQGDIRTTSSVTGDPNVDEHTKRHGIEPGLRCRQCGPDDLCPHDVARRYGPCLDCRNLPRLAS